jgi:coatomer subunit beta'
VRGTGRGAGRGGADGTQVVWSGSGERVAILADDSFYVLRFDRGAYAARAESGADLGDEGVEEAFEIEAEIADR